MTATQTIHHSRSGEPGETRGGVTWAFVLEEAPGNATRLVIRWRSQTPATLRDLLLSNYLLEPIHFTMERRMTLGLRERAESQ